MAKQSHSKHQRLVLCEHGAKRVPYLVEGRIHRDLNTSAFKETYVVTARCIFGLHYLAPKIAAFQGPDGVFDGMTVVVEEFTPSADTRFAYQWASEREAQAAVAAWDAMMERRSRESDAYA